MHRVQLGAEDPQSGLELTQPVQGHVQDDEDKYLENHVNGLEPIHLDLLRQTISCVNRRRKESLFDRSAMIDHARSVERFRTNPEPIQVELIDH